MRALLNGSAVELRNGLALEMLPGEILEILPEPLSVELVSINGEPAEFSAEAREITLETIGRHHFRITPADGSRFDVFLVCFESAVLAFVSPQVRYLGHGDSQPEGSHDVKVRSVVRALANHAEWFDGTKASLANQSLAPFGC